METMNETTKRRGNELLRKKHSRYKYRVKIWCTVIGWAECRSIPSAPTQALAEKAASLAIQANPSMFVHTGQMQHFATFKVVPTPGQLDREVELVREWSEYI